MANYVSPNISSPNSNHLEILKDIIFNFERVRTEMYGNVRVRTEMYGNVDYITIMLDKRSTASFIGRRPK